MVSSGSPSADANSPTLFLESYASGTSQGNHRVPERTINEHTVQLPDLFSSLMAIKPAVNPNYHEVKAKGNSWVIKNFHVNDDWAARFSMIEFPYMCSMWAPYCDEDHLQLVVDWNNWLQVFIFDDEFDEGRLSKDPVAAQMELDKFLAIMDSSRPSRSLEEDPLGYLFQTIWDRVKMWSPQVMMGSIADIAAAMQQRVRDVHRYYFDGLLRQVRDAYDQRVLTQDTQEHILNRRRTVAVYPTIVICEVALGIQLPQEFIDHPCYEQLVHISTEIVILDNDILSYKKDREQGVDQNLIMLLKEQGLFMQQAVDEIGHLLNVRYKRWYAALANMPILGEKSDRQVLKFVELCQNVAVGSLYWSFRTGRYSGLDDAYNNRLLRID
ncbi:Presilphiperfolan-8-beta-ol synthase [Penicillium desertorum]|uniref:Terpene synthase n=1 Tax=Penicillium desertorum TaxID=1303715 RepID=A0A9X0BQN0_9EURO|nr:Presilphiperfolan-8-beta-ol synthase [Penicillium desertorum]